MLNEKVYHSDKDVKYILDKGHNDVKKLIVIFSGYAENTATIKHKYNYMKILKDVNVHKLFILDDNGVTGSYYLGKFLNFNVDSSVISLILSTARNLNINLEDIISLGSSKGGSAALYFGLKYKFGAVFSGAFQTRISDLIIARRPESKEFLLGNPDSKEYAERYNQLNNLMFNLLNTPVQSNLYLVSGKKDWQYSIHVKPFIEKMDELNITYDLHLSEKMRNHSEISIYFPDYFKTKIIKELFNIDIQIINLQIETNAFTFEIEAQNNSYNKYNLLFNYTVNSKEYVLKKNIKEYTKIPGFYNFYLTVKNQSNDSLYKVLLDTHFFDADKVTEPIVETTLENGVLKCLVSTNSNLKIKYAYYILENEKTIKKIMYQESNVMEYKTIPGNSYKVQTFLMTEEGHKIVKMGAKVFS